MGSSEMSNPEPLPLSTFTYPVFLNLLPLTSLMIGFGQPFLIQVLIFSHSPQQHLPAYIDLLPVTHGAPCMSCLPLPRFLQLRPELSPSPSVLSQSFQST